MLRLSRLAGLLLIAAGVLTLILLCWLPYRVPVAPTASDSFLFGYNNRAALVIAAFFAVACGLIGNRSGSSELPSAPGSAMPRRTLHQAVAITFTLCFLLHLVTRRANGYVESPYFVDRIKLMLAGRVPYRDFEYVYGVSFLYPPAWFSRLFHIPAVDAYGFLWIVVSLLGLWMLFVSLQWLPAAASVKRSIFLFFCGFSIFLLLCDGVNYSLFRFILPCFLALWIDRNASHYQPDNARTILMVSPCFLAILLVSPEMALSFLFGIVCYLALITDLRLPANRVALAATVLASAALTVIAARCGVFITLNAFRGGGFNFPVMPATTIILLLIVIAVSATYAGAELRSRQRGPLLAMIAVSAPALAAALGRCDSVHVLMNPLGLWIATFVIAGASPRLGRGWFAACAAIFLVVPLCLGARSILVAPSRAALLTIYGIENSLTHPPAHLDALLLRVATRLYGAGKAGVKIGQTRSFATLHDGVDLNAIFGYPEPTVFRAPFQFSPGDFGPLHSPQVETGYFYGTVNLVTEAAVRRKVRELAANPAQPLLLLPGAEMSCTVSPELERASLRNIFLYPYTAPVRNPGSVLMPLCQYIRDHYVMAEQASEAHLGYAVWQRHEPVSTTGDVPLAQSTAPDAPTTVHPAHP